MTLHGQIPLEYTVVHLLHGEATTYILKSQIKCFDVAVCMLLASSELFKRLTTGGCRKTKALY